MCCVFLLFLQKSWTVISSKLTDFYLASGMQALISSIINVPSIKSLLSVLSAALYWFRWSFSALTEMDFDSNIFLKIISLVLYYSLFVVVMFLICCIFVSIVINPFYDPMEAYDIGLLIFTITGWYPLTTILM